MASTKALLQSPGSDHLGRIEFKHFLQKNLRDDQAFANNIFSQFRDLSQH